MYCKIEEKEVLDIEPTNIVQQTSFWAEIKSSQGFTPYAFEYKISGDVLSPFVKNTKYFRDDLLVLIRYIDNDHCFAYIPYGPFNEPDFENQGVFMEELSEVLRSHLPDNCILIRFDLLWENQWAHEDDLFDDHGNWNGPPPHKNQEFRVNFNTKNRNLFKSPGDILPTNTIFLNLEKNREELIQKMKSKTRYNIRLAYRKGVEVKCYGIEKLDEWYSLYRETALRNKITLHPMANFYSVLSRNENGFDDVSVRLIMAGHEGEYLAAMFLVMSKKRGTYLYGASSGSKRNLMASYAVQWEAIRIAQQAGCEEYDMFGTAPNSNSSHPLYGLYRFKKGFGGHLYHRMGCWDYPYDMEQYMSFRAQEVTSQGYHIN